MYTRPSTSMDSQSRIRKTIHKANLYIYWKKSTCKWTWQFKPCCSRINYKSEHFMSMYQVEVPTFKRCCPHIGPGSEGLLSPWGSWGQKGTDPHQESHSEWRAELGFDLRCTWEYLLLYLSHLDPPKGAFLEGLQALGRQVEAVRGGRRSALGSRSSEAFCHLRGNTSLNIPRSETTKKKSGFRLFA